MKNTDTFNNEMQLKFLNISENEMLARTAIMGFLSYLNPTFSWINELKTAVSEGVTNSIIHAYDTKDNYVELKVKVNKEKVIVEIKDEGKGIIEDKKNNKSERAGMGFEIMRAFTDSMKINTNKNCGTIVTLEKIIEKGKQY